LRHGKSLSARGASDALPQINIADEIRIVRELPFQDYFKFQYKLKATGSLKIDSRSIIWRTVLSASVAVQIMFPDEDDSWQVVMSKKEHLTETLFYIFDHLSF